MKCVELTEFWASLQSLSMVAARLRDDVVLNGIQNRQKQSGSSFQKNQFGEVNSAEKNLLQRGLAARQC